MLLELIQTVEDTAASSGVVTVLIDNLSKAIARVIIVVIICFIFFCFFSRR